MEEKYEKILNILGIITISLIVIFIIFFIIEFKEMLNDHRCYTMPLNEFYKDKKCEKYWDFKKWGNR